MGYNVKKESRASLCKLGSWNIRLHQDTSAFVFINEAGSRWCRSAECCLSPCPAASQSSHYSLDHGQNIHTISEKFAAVSPCFDHQINSALGWSHFFFPSTVTPQCQHLALKFLQGFCLCKTVNSISFGIKALISPLKYHINAELPWVDEFTVLVNLFC